MAKEEVVTVNGFKITSVSLAKETVKIVLVAAKDEITAGTYNIGDVFQSLAITQLAEMPIQFGVLMNGDDE